MIVQPANQVIRFARVAVMQPFVAYFESIGVSTEKYLLQVGLTPAMLNNHRGLIDLIFQFLEHMVWEKEKSQLARKVINSHTTH